MRPRALVLKNARVDLNINKNVKVDFYDPG